jgi:hypothetical protein
MPTKKKTSAEKTVIVSIRLPAKDAEALARKAKADGRTRNSLCAKHLKEKAAAR